MKQYLSNALILEDKHAYDKNSVCMQKLLWRILLHIRIIQMH